MTGLIKQNSVGESCNYDLLPSEMTKLIAVKDSINGKFSLRVSSMRCSLLFLASLNFHVSRANDFFHDKVGRWGGEHLSE